MNTLLDDAHQLALDELPEVYLLGLAQRREGLVHIGVQLRAYVLAIKAQGALQMSERIWWSGTTPSLAAKSLRARDTLALRRDLSLREISW